jgi:hypothetical protein
MTRDRAIAAAEAYFDEGGFTEDLARRVAIQSESQVPERASMLARYLDGEIAPSLQRLGFATETVANPAGAGPMLIAKRNGQRACHRGGCSGGATAYMAAAPPTIRVSTRSISPPSTRRSRSAADSASTSFT